MGFNVCVGGCGIFERGLHGFLAGFSIGYLSLKVLGFGVGFCKVFARFHRFRVWGFWRRL